MTRVLTREQVQALLEKVVRLSKAERVSVRLSSTWSANIRFAANQLSTVGSIEDADVDVESWFGSRHATVSTNDLSDASLRDTVSRSEALAKLAPADPEDLPPLGPQTYTPVPAQFDRTDDSTPEDRVDAALSALKITRASTDLECAGYLQTDSTAFGIMNSAGLFAFHRSSGNDYSLTVRTKDGTGSGWAATDHPDWTKIDFEKVSAKAIEKARASRNPVAIEPGRYTVVLEPAAVGNLVPLIGQSLNARAADEGRSAFTKSGGGNRIGEQVMDSHVTLMSDPRDPLILARPFDTEGLPLSRQVWVENGVLKQLAYTRFWARKQGKQPTGGAGGGGGLKLQGGTTSLEDMIKSIERGILCTHFFYIRSVDPRTVLNTGLTRDGTFLIENGKIARPIKNFRWNESPLFLLNNLEALGPSERMGNSAMPAIKARDFNFTSLSDAV